MSGYQVEVVRLPVRVVDFLGDSLQADFFLHRTGEHQPGPETLGERLNRPHTRFLPFEVDGSIELLSLAAVAYVEHAGPLIETEVHRSLGGRQEPVTIRLRSGEILTGDLLYLFTGSGARVLDRINSSSERFLLLISGDLARYVNTDAVQALRV
jgi:hypothetical protein